MLQIKDKWVWDFWFAQDGPDTHIFYLQAPRDLPEEVMRHWHVSIGHAVSQDLINWEVLPDALHPSPKSEDAWDNASTWTGSVFHHNDTWYLFYTGAKHQEKGLVQRIGVATSTNLIDWQKHPKNPLIVADPQWYELLDLDMWHDQAWRDPCIFEYNGRFHAFITARSNQGHKSERGVIGHAISDDLIHWEARPPVTEPGEFGHMEVPQLVEINGRFYLLFCTTADTHSAHRNERLDMPPVTGTHYLVSDSPLGPFKYATDNFLAGDAVGTLYSGKLVQNPEGVWCFIAFRNFDEDGNFIGEIIDPMPIIQDQKGNLHLNNL